jgi:hypothetical protein
MHVNIESTRMKHRSLLRIIILCTLSAPFLTAQDALSLEYKFPKGKIYRYRTVTNNSMANEMKGFSTTTNSSSNSVAKFTVEGITPNHSFVLLASIDSFLTLVNGQPAAGPSADIVGKRTRLTVSKQGEIERREIIDSISVNGFDMNKMQFTGILPLLPEKKISAGNKWSTTKIDTMVFFGIAMINKTTTDYTVTGTEKRNGRSCITINSTAVVSMSGSGQAQGVEATASGTTNSSGVYYFDAAAGLLIADESTTNGTTSITMQNGMSISMTMTGNTVKTLLE